MDLDDDDAFLYGDEEPEVKPSAEVPANGAPGGEGKTSDSAMEAAMRATLGHNDDLDDLYTTTPISTTSPQTQSLQQESARSTEAVAPGYSRENAAGDVNMDGGAGERNDEEEDQDDEDEEEDEEDEDDGLEILMNAPQRSMDFRNATSKPQTGLANIAASGMGMSAATLAALKATKDAEAAAARAASGVEAAGAGTGAVGDVKVDTAGKPHAIVHPSQVTSDYIPHERGAPLPAASGSTLTTSQQPIIPSSVDASAGQLPGDANPMLGTHPGDVVMGEPPVALGSVGHNAGEEAAQINAGQNGTIAYQAVPVSTLPIPRAPGSHPTPSDPSTFKLEPPTDKTGQSIYDYDVAVLKSTGQPWRKPGSDLSKWFNYGFDEETWVRYLGWRKGMVMGREGMRTVGVAERMPDELADMMGLERMPQEVQQPGQMMNAAPGMGNLPGMGGDQNNGQQMQMQMPGMDGQPGMPDMAAMGMNMPNMFGGMANMPNMPNMEQMMAMMPNMQGMDFGQMANMMNMFGGGQGGQGMPDMGAMMGMMGGMGDGQGQGQGQGQQGGEGERGLGGQVAGSQNGEVDEKPMVEGAGGQGEETGEVDEFGRSISRPRQSSNPPAANQNNQNGDGNLPFPNGFPMGMNMNMLNNMPFMNPNNLPNMPNMPNMAGINLPNIPGTGAPNAPAGPGAAGRSPLPAAGANAVIPPSGPSGFRGGFRGRGGPIRGGPAFRGRGGAPPTGPRGAVPPANVPTGPKATRPQRDRDRFDKSNIELDYGDSSSVPEPNVSGSPRRRDRYGEVVESRPDPRGRERDASRHSESRSVDVRDDRDEGATGGAKPEGAESRSRHGSIDRRGSVMSTSRDEGAAEPSVKIEESGPGDGSAADPKADEAESGRGERTRHTRASDRDRERESGTTRTARHRSSRDEAGRTDRDRERHRSDRDRDGKESRRSRSPTRDREKEKEKERERGSDRHRSSRDKEREEKGKASSRHSGSRSPTKDKERERTRGDRDRTRDKEKEREREKDRERRHRSSRSDRDKEKEPEKVELKIAGVAAAAESAGAVEGAGDAASVAAKSGSESGRGEREKRRTTRSEAERTRKRSRSPSADREAEASRTRTRRK